MQVRIGRSPNTLDGFRGKIQGDFLNGLHQILVKIYTKNGFIIKFSGIR